MEQTVEVGVDGPVDVDAFLVGVVGHRIGYDVVDHREQPNR